MHCWLKEVPCDLLRSVSSAAESAGGGRSQHAPGGPGAPAETSSPLPWQALGLKPKSVRQDVTAHLEQGEIDKLLKGERGEGEGDPDPDRQAGLGFGPG